jgi:parallel beta-helix repeat protein
MTRKTAPSRTVVSLSALALVATSGLLFAGPLDPPAGPVTSTYKTLTEVEPRTAVNATNTPGDADSLFKITQPGSYYLTGNITGVVGRHGIEIAASGVTLDLNGFDLVGVAGSLDGVRSSVSSLTNLTVRDGSVRSWGGHGVQLTFSSNAGGRVHAVLSSGNGGVGILVGDATVVTECSSLNNVGTGINTGSVCIVTGCSSHNNAGTGISTGGGSTVIDCSLSNNAGTGISVASGSTVSRCTVLASGEFGIGTSSSCSVLDCTVRASTRDGIRCAGSGSQIRGNDCALNGINAGDGAGIVVVSIENKIEGNHCSSNDRGIDVQAAGNFIVRNTCADNTVEWVIVANNVYGPIINRSAPASPAVNGPAAASTLSSTDPNANFTY